MVDFNSLRHRLETVDRNEPQSREETLGPFSSRTLGTQSTTITPRSCPRLLAEWDPRELSQDNFVVVETMGRRLLPIHAMCEQKVQSAQKGAQRTPQILLGKPIQDSAVHPENERTRPIHSEFRPIPLSSQ